MTRKVVHITMTLRNRFKVLYFPFVTNAELIVFTTKRNMKTFQNKLYITPQ